MRINNNLMAMNTHRQLGLNANNGAKSIEKLSSGFRINRAGDDAAGLAISEKMRAQIRGLNQASRNSQDAISLVQTAEGALNETQAILQRMRELSVQSANDTNVSVDRDALQNEIDQLTTEIDRIGDTTEFNTRKLLNGGASVSASKTGAAADIAKVNVTGGSGDTTVGSTIVITAATLATADNGTTTATPALKSTAMTAASTININGISFSFDTSNTVQDVLDTVNGAGIGVTASHTDGAGIVFTDNQVGSASSMTISSATGSLAGADTVTQGVDATVTLTGSESYIASGNKITIADAADAANGLEFELSGSAITASVTLTVTSNGGLNMQIGANEGQEMYVSIGDMRSSALGVNGIDITSASSAKAAITTVNDAITSVSTERAKLGAVQNRLEHTIKNLDTSAENLQASESRIRDVDMAKEMMEFTKNNILQQAAQAMLAQANNAPQGVLQLLR
jgi:flagellin